MTGHKKFSNLTKDFSAERKAKIATQTAKLKEEMALAELRQSLLKDKSPDRNLVDELITERKQEYLSE